MPTVGFLHTSRVHAATFDALVFELAPTWATVHAVDEALLDRARAGDVGVTEAVDRAVRDLAALDVQLVVCTCSTVGGLAELSVIGADVPVVRVDRPMAELTVDTGRRIAVVAALESTVGPTTELLHEVAAERHADLELELVVIDGAWERFEADDLAGYHASIARQLPSIAERSDVVVLAQASMAGAADVVGDLGVPVLASPRVAVERLLAT